MELQHLIAKLYVTGDLKLDPAQVVNLFHQWVAQQSVPGVTLVDVAELLHVPHGPGVIAVGVDADYALDHTDGKWGVLYRHKTALPGSNADQEIFVALDGNAIPVLDSIITLDTTQYPDGPYTIRLRVVREDGNYEEYFANIMIANGNS